jgi:hypothetical protein
MSSAGSTPMRSASATATARSTAVEADARAANIDGSRRTIERRSFHSPLSAARRSAYSRRHARSASVGVSSTGRSRRRPAT